MKSYLQVSVITILSLFATQVNATFMPWGTGMWGGMQSCPYQFSAGANVQSYVDDLKQAQKLYTTAQRDLSKAQRELEKVDREIERGKQKIERNISESFTEIIYTHMESGSANCKEYDTKDENTKLFVQHLCKDKADINSSVACSKSDFKKQGYVPPQAECVNAFKSVRDNLKKKQKLQADVEMLKGKVDDLEARMTYAKEDIQRAYEDSAKERTEGTICWECLASNGGFSYQRAEPDWASVGTNVGVGLLAILAGQQHNKNLQQSNAALGWPTQSMPAIGYGLPFITAGIYGALGGGIGAGGFGCAGGMGGAGFGNGPMGMMGPFGMGSIYGPMGAMGGAMGGAMNPFGYPMGMMNPMLGGGMYLPGMGPFGVAGPWGLGGQMGMGNPFGLMGQMGMGSPYGPYGMMGNPYGMMGGMPGGPFGGQFGLGFPYGGMGGPFGGMGGMGPYGMGGPFGGMGGMGPYGMGGPFGGMGGMGPYGMGGPFGGMGGYNPYGNMMGMGPYGPMGMMGQMGNPMLGMPGMPGYPGMMGGMPGMMPGMDSGMQMQLQQQMMQMQMQQYQQQMQMQMQMQQQQMQAYQQYQQNAMARQRMVSSLQQELYSLMNRIQQVQMGYGASGYIGAGGGVNMGGTINGGFNPQPIQGGTPMR